LSTSFEAFRFVRHIRKVAREGARLGSEAEKGTLAQSADPSQLLSLAFTARFLLMANPEVAALLLGLMAFSAADAAMQGPGLTEQQKYVQMYGVATGNLLYQKKFMEQEIQRDLIMKQ